jgi:hypothetical protein
MTKRTLLISIPVVALVLNGLGYLIVTRLRAPSHVVAPEANTARPAAPSAAGGALPDGEGAPVVDDPKAKEERAQARRAAGLVALEAGDYQKALINFTEAKVLIGDRAKVDELLQVTEDLRTHPPAPPKSRAVAPAQAAAPPRSTTRTSSPRRVAIREDAPAEVSPVASPATSPPPPSGLLIVTTTPRGILVQVDEAPIDITPMRTKVKPGSHRVALLDGDRKVYETTVDVKEGATATLLRDVSAERTTEAPRLAAPPPAAVSPPKEEAPRVAAAPVPQKPPSTAMAAPARIVEVPDRTQSGRGSSETGALEISSPGLYGVVWINGRPRGYPPLEVRELPAGSAKVEVRVNGVQRRSATVVVKPGISTAVSLRSQDTAP